MPTLFTGLTAKTAKGAMIAKRAGHVVLLAACCSAAADAQTLSRPALLKALQAGGNVIVMRHASSPGDIPAKPNPDNVPPERQLDEKGRTTAAAMGDALRRLKIPIGEVLTSPTYRAGETARVARLPNPRAIAQLGEGPQSMQGAVNRAQTEWLQKKVKELPRGTNTLLITHVPNVTAAFPGEVPAVDQGEALVFGSDGAGGSRVVGRIKIEEWAGL
jgi:phosphohistidine phosphatase SixA